MKKLKSICISVTLLAIAMMPAKAQKWEHLADTPQMGWLSHTDSVYEE